MLMTNNDGDDEDRNEPKELGGGQGMGMEMGPPIGQVFRNAS